MENITESSIQQPAHKFATIRRRLAASIIDTAILSVVLYFIIYPLLGVNLISLFSVEPNAYVEKITQISTLSNIFFILVNYVYQFYFFVYSGGASVGQKILQIRVVREDGKAITFGTVLVRYIVSYFSSLVLSLGYIWAIFDKKKQTWHDKAAHTLVVENEKKPNYALVIFLVIATFLFNASMFSISFAKAFTNGVQNASTYQKQEHSSTIWKSNEAQEMFKQSSTLFAQIKENSADEPKVRELNDENIQVLQDAIEIEPDNALLWYSLSMAYTWTSTSGTLADGLEAAQKAAELKPSDATIVENYGILLVMDEQYDEAVLQLKKSTRIKATPMAYEYLGKSYAQLKVYDESIASYQKAIDLYETDNENGQYDAAILRDQQSITAVEQVKAGFGTLNP